MVNKENATLVHLLAEKLKVDLRDSSFAIATSSQNAFARTSDCSLDVALFQDQNEVDIETPRGPGVRISLVDHTKPGFEFAPRDAVYAINAYLPAANRKSVGESGEELNGDIATIYVGRNGLILNEPALQRASKLYEIKHGS